ncbi:hypothetical protein [Roseateles sp. P5_E11]
MAFASNTLQNFEQVSYGPSGLSMHRARARQQIALQAARTLTIKESGSLVLLDAAAGFTVTLPPPVVGAFYDFLCTVTVTSSNAKIITDAATTFMLGEVLAYTTATASPAGFAFNGTTHVACTMNGTTTGAIIGTRIRVEAISSTVWAITGTVVGSGTIATPAATS